MKNRERGLLKIVECLKKHNYSISRILPSQKNHLKLPFEPINLLNFVFWEGLGRFIVDFYRDEKVFYLANTFTMGQILSAIMVVVAGWILLKHYNAEWKKILK